jgi:hypothetical protein
MKINSGSSISSAAVRSRVICFYGYIRGKTRASMADDTAANVTLTSELEDVIGDVCLSFARVYTLRFEAVVHELTWG